MGDGMDLQITPLSEWGLPLEDLFLCAGPCSAETEEQLLSTAEALADCPISFLRAGLWKPRTHPDSFQGVGLDGLAWLKRAKEKFQVPVGIEVANPMHVEACLEHDVDVVWIGARTTPNPFAVQELADAMKGTDMRVFVKNPISPDIETWIGAIERFHNAGLRKIGVIHRGFSTSRKVIYRYAPHWRIPIELKRRIPGIPILCDPSHISGKSELVYSVAQEAIDLLYDGLMVEVHITPERALSDARQQLSPKQFRALLDRLSLKKEVSESEEFQARIRELRSRIDTIDENLLDLLSKRMETVSEMGEVKRKNNISALQPQRWQELLANRIEEGKKLSLSEEFVLQLFQIIHAEAIQHQKERA